jgi:hypothetical protein
MATILANKAQTQAALKTTGPVIAKLHTSITQAKDAFAATIGRITKAHTDVADAKGLYDAAGVAQVGIRQTILCELAEAAIAGKWLPEHAKAGIDAAIAAYAEAANDKDAANKTVGTLKQFASECMRAVHPKAREHVQAAFDEADEMWEAEGERLEIAKAEAKAAGTKFIADPAETPLRAAFKRKWHMVAGSTGLLAARASDDADKAALAEAPEMLADAVAHDERIDAKRAAKAIKRVLDVIEDVAEEFPHNSWDTVLRFLNGLNAKKLADYRAKEVRGRSNPTSSKPVRKATSADVDDAADALLDA